MLPLSALPFASTPLRSLPSRHIVAGFRITATIFPGNQEGKDFPSRPAGALVPYGIVLAQKCARAPAADERLPEEGSVTCEHPYGKDTSGKARVRSQIDALCMKVQVA